MQTLVVVRPSPRQLTVVSPSPAKIVIKKASGIPGPPGPGLKDVISATEPVDPSIMVWYKIQEG